MSRGKQGRTVPTITLPALQLQREGLAMDDKWPPMAYNGLDLSGR